MKQALLKIASMVGFGQASTPVAQAEWVDDSVLRQLVQEYHDDKTNWILASDLAEFYGRLDNIFTRTPFLIEMDAKLSAQLGSWLEKGFHLKDARDDYRIGPQSWTGMRLRRGHQVLPFDYKYNFDETYFELKPQGRAPVRYQCGMPLEEVLRETDLTQVSAYKQPRVG